MARADTEEEFATYAAALLPSLCRTAFLLCQDWHRAEHLSGHTTSAAGSQGTDPVVPPVAFGWLPGPRAALFS
jgi:hypothetical protein